MSWLASRPVVHGETARLTWRKTRQSITPIDQVRPSSTNLPTNRQQDDELPSSRPMRHRLARFVDPNSLENTLGQHREANEKSRIKFLPWEQDQSHDTWIETRAKSRQLKARARPQRDPLRQQAFTFLAKNGLDAPRLPTPDSVQSGMHVESDVQDRRTKMRKRFLEDHGLWSEDLREDGSWDRLNLVLKSITTHMLNRLSRSERAQVPLDLLEYIGEEVLGTMHAEPGVESEPWADVRQDLESIARLDTEIAKFAQWAGLTEDEQRSRDTVAKMALDLVRDTVPQLEGELVGTSATGLATPTSDIDIRVFTDRSDDKDKQAQLTAGLVEVGNALSQHPDFDQISMLRHPFVLVQARHTPSGLTVQVVAGPSHAASVQYVRECLAQYPQLKTVYHLVKATFESRDQVSPYRGYMSSYGLFNMIVASLKARETMREADDELFHIDEEVYRTHLALPPSTIFIRPSSFFPSLYLPSAQSSYPSSPALQLLDFLFFWSNFSSFSFSLSASTGTLARKTRAPPGPQTPLFRAQAKMSLPIPHQRYLLTLQDGANPSNDLGRRAHGWKHMAATTAGLWRTLSARMALPPPPAITTKSHKHAHDAVQLQLARRIAEAASPPAPVQPSTAPSDDGVGREPRRVPLLRVLVGRADRRVQSTRDRLEMFARGQVAAELSWRPAKEQKVAAKAEVAALVAGDVAAGSAAVADGEEEWPADALGDGTGADPPRIGVRAVAGEEEGAATVEQGALGAKDTGVEVFTATHEAPAGAGKGPENTEAERKDEGERQSKESRAGVSPPRAGAGAELKHAPQTRGPIRDAEDGSRSVERQRAEDVSWPPPIEEQRAENVSRRVEEQGVEDWPADAMANGYGEVGRGVVREDPTPQDRRGQQQGGEVDDWPADAVVEEFRGVEEGLGKHVK